MQIEMQYYFNGKSNTFFRIEKHPKHFGYYVVSTKYGEIINDCANAIGIAQIIINLESHKYA